MLILVHAVCLPISLRKECQTAQVDSIHDELL